MKTAKKTPLISIIVPIYNVEKYLRQCLDSILAQTLTDIEIILVDDGSPDNCPQICDEYAAKDKRVRVIHKTNAGLGAAYNTGIDAATGDYIGFVEPDDWIEPDMYEVMYKNAKYYNTDATKCGFWQYNSVRPALSFNRQGILGIICNEPRGVFQIEDYPLLCAYHSSIWSYIYKSSFIKKIKFVETEGGAAYVDAPFGYEVLCKAERLSIVPRSFYHWRVENHGNSVSIKDNRVMAMADRFIEAKEILKKYNKYETLKEIFYFHAFTANYQHYQDIETKFKHQYFKKLQNLFSDLKSDHTFQWKYLDKERQKWIKNIIKNHYLTTIFKNKKQYLSFLFNLKISKKGFLFQLFGLQISNKAYANYFSYLTIKIGA